MSHGIVTDTRITREELLARRDRPAHVIGAASAEGVAVARLLLRLGFEDVTLHDQRAREQLYRAFRTTHGAWGRDGQAAIWAELKPLVASARLGDEYLAGIADADDGALVVLPQGWYLDAANRAAIVDAVGEGRGDGGGEHGGPLVTSMTELYAALHPGPTALVTGTNGKSTTTALVDHLLEQGGVAHRTAGNERSSRQYLHEVGDVAPGTWALMEVSNRQLLQVARGQQVAAITALTPDHLDEHGGWDGYRAAKRRAFEFQAPDAIAIACADDADALAAAAASPAAAAGRLVRCGTGDHPAPSVTWRDGVLIAEDVPVHHSSTRIGQVVLASAGDVKLPGEHNLRNVAVGAAVALACGVDPTRIAPALRDFAGASLRLEPLGEVAGVQVWNDIKSTTPEAAIAALSAAHGRHHAVLVVGGEDKGLDYGPLADAILAEGAGCIAVPGSATELLEDALAGRGGRLERADDLDAALDAALASTSSGDVVIVSPAAAGFWSSQLQGKATLRARIRQRAEQVQEVPRS